MGSHRRNEIVTEIIIEGTAADVWNVLVDLESYPDWNPFITRSTGEIKLGGTLENVLMSNGKPLIFKPVITDVQEGQRFEWLGRTFLGGFRGRHYFELVESGSGFTKLIHGEIFSGFLATVLLPLIREDTQKNFIAMNKALQLRLQGLSGPETRDHENP